MGTLILVRHGESEWNALGLWTGLTDIGLSEKGRAEARRSAELIRGVEIHVCHSSTLSRARHTLDEMRQCLDWDDLPIHEHSALNERDYGELTGKNKWQVREEFGEEQFILWRRSWDHPLPGGETLKDVYRRVVPYFEEQIQPSVISGQNVLVSFHGNSMRALVKYLDEISDEEIPHLEIATGEVYLYQFDAEGKIINKEIRKSNYGQGI